MKRLLTYWVIIASATLVACGGGGNTITDPGSGAGGGPGPGGQTVEMGSGVPPAFSAGQIGVAVANLAAGGSTSLTVSFATSDGVLFTESVDVTFSSGCLSSGLANISGDTNTVTGTLTVTYSATGCSGDDVITASAIIGGVGLSATGSVNVAAAAVGSIEFISADPPQIGLQGTGGVGLSETSTVSFRVVDATGGPVSGTDVDFSLNTNVGGITFTPSNATSGVDGRVQTVIQAGTVATSLRVTATINSLNPPISTQSSQLIVTTGLPDQDSMSISFEELNPEAFDFDGVQVEVTVRMADRFGNPVPDGTAVTLNTEGGKIAGGCVTETTGVESGVCTVNWTSQDPRPVNGRVTIIATAIGEETFVDGNGNGFFDDPDSFTDLDEAFRDDNENNTYDVGEFFFDFNNDNMRTLADGQFNGLLCGGPGGAGDTMGRCSPSPTIGISTSGVLVMSGSAAVIDDDVNGTLDLTQQSTVTFTIGDVRDQPMPVGTTVTAQVSEGRIIGPTEFTVPNTNFDGPLNFSFTVDGANAQNQNGFMSIAVETPSGLVTNAIINMILF